MIDVRLTIACAYFDSDYGVLGGCGWGGEGVGYVVRSGGMGCTQNGQWEVQLKTKLKFTPTPVIFVLFLYT